MKAPSITRRQTMRLLAAAPVVASLPRPASATETLEAFLKTVHISRQPSRLGVFSVSEMSREIEVVIELTWPPGYRRHRFVASSPDAICAEIETYFSALG